MQDRFSNHFPVFWGRFGFSDSIIICFHLSGGQPSFKPGLLITHTFRLTRSLPDTYQYGVTTVCRRKDPDRNIVEIFSRPKIIFTPGAPKFGVERLNGAETYKETTTHYTDVEFYKYIICTIHTNNLEWVRPSFPSTVLTYMFAVHYYYYIFLSLAIQFIIDHKCIDVPQRVN